jgi:rare lipoprotein A
MACGLLDVQVCAVVGFCALTTIFVGLLGCGASAELRAGKIGTVEEGKATYYSRRLVGRRTASGERYDPNQMTAAHHVLPFGTYVRVTRADDPQKSVVVRINDRCAKTKKIIDVSAAAARQLQMIRAGIVPVRIEVVSIDST